jgi:ABC-type glycerol-3-phosphate transport system substrate-binding protein
MNHVMLDTVIKANGGEVLNADFTQCQLTQPASLEAIQWVVDLVQEHGVAPNPTLAAQADTAPTFASGRIAMALDGSYQIASLQEVTAFDWDITLVPSGDSKRVVYGGPDSLSIAQRSSNPEAAWTFVKFFLSEDVGMKSFGAGSIPVNRALAGSDAWLTSVSKPANYGLLVEQEPYVVGADFGPSWIQWRVEAMNRELESAILGTRPVAEAAAAACGEIDAILAKVERK